jgi:hypothetical protein
MKQHGAEEHFITPVKVLIKLQPVGIPVADERMARMPEEKPDDLAFRYKADMPVYPVEYQKILPHKGNACSRLFE